MKTFVLMCSRITAYFRKNKLIFLLFVLGGILNSFVLACFFGEAQELIRTVAAPEGASYYREYGIQWWPYAENKTSIGSEALLGFASEKSEFVDGEYVQTPVEGWGDRKLTLDQAKTLVESDLLESVTVTFISREQNTHNNLFSFGVDEFTVKALIKGNTPFAGISQGIDEPLEFARGNVKYEDLADDEIILDIGHSAKVGDTVTVSGMNFRVAAVAKNLPIGNNLITPKAMEKLSKGALDKISVVATEKYNSKANPVTELFHSLFTEYDIVYDDIPYPVPTEIENSYFLSRPDGGEIQEMPKQEVQRYTERLLLIFFCYFASQGAFLILLRYLLNSLAEENAVSMIAGMKRHRLSLLIFLECLVLSVVSSLLGLFLHKALMPTLFVHINSAYYLADTFTEYARLFVMMLGINLAALIPFVLLYRTKTPIELRRR